MTKLKHISQQPYRLAASLGTPKLQVHIFSYKYSSHTPSRQTLAAFRSELWSKACTQCMGQFRSQSQSSPRIDGVFSPNTFLLPGRETLMLELFCPLHRSAVGGIRAQVAKMLIVWD